MTGAKSSAKQNPEARSGETRIESDRELRKAAELLEDFSGHHPTELFRATEKQSRKGLVIGDLDFVGYTTIRDGEIEKYIHRFKKKSRPLLAVTSGGKQLRIVGGQYEFTEAGIEDR